MPDDKKRKSVPGVIISSSPLPIDKAAPSKEVLYDKKRFQKAHDRLFSAHSPVNRPGPLILRHYIYSIRKAG